MTSPGNFDFLAEHSPLLANLGAIAERLYLRQLGYHPRLPEPTKSAEVGLALMLALRTTLRSQEVL
jgi:hypothetical protein